MLKIGQIEPECLVVTRERVERGQLYLTRAQRRYPELREHVCPLNFEILKSLKLAFVFVIWQLIKGMQR